MKAAYLFLLLLSFVVVSNPAVARPGPLLIILVPGTSLHDWQTANAPYLHQLMATGALAVLNTRTARLPNDLKRETPESALLTLGAGSRAAGSATATHFVPTTALTPGMGVSAGKLYERRMGWLAPSNALVNPHWPEVLQENRGRGYDIRLGNLADTLRAAGVIIQSEGGAYADLIGTAHNGISQHAPSHTIVPNGCLVWDVGSKLAAADKLLPAAVSAIAAQDGHLIIISPFASDSDYYQGYRLTPVLEWGEGIPAGLLTSRSTRRAGLVTNTDFAPTVAAYFGLTTMPVRPFGQAWTAVPTPRSEQIVSGLEEQAYHQERGMKLLPYLAVAISGWVLAGTTLLMLRKMPAYWPLLPLSLLLSLLFSDRATAVPLYFALVFLIAWVGQRRFGADNVLLTLLAALSATMILDMVTGSHLMKRSILGYSAVEGARYYGIGNEAMGALIGCLLVLTARLWRNKRGSSIALSLLVGVTAILLGSPLAGAKAGGFLVSLLAFGTLLFNLWGGKLSLKVGLALLFSAAGILAITALADALLPAAGHSHMGEAVRRINAGGLGEAVDIIQRKLGVESRLMYHSAWACPLWIGLLCLLKLENRSALSTAGLVAILSCLAFNDAGVVAAALCLVPLWADAALWVHSKKPLMA